MLAAVWLTNTFRRSGAPPQRFLVGAALVLGIGHGAAASAATDLVVFEASSLKDAFAKLAQRFEKDNAGVKVVTNAAGSQELRTQIEHGAAADVMASADRKHMDALLSQGLVVAPSVFTCNEPVVVVRAALAPSIRTLADLPRAERIVIGVPDVPIGAYTLQILKRAAAKYGADFPKRVEAKVASRELNVRQVLAKIALGEADAGVVYRSDAIAARGKVEILAIPAELNVIAEYPIATLKAAPRPDLARRWIDLVKSAEGTAALREAGFSACPHP
jgi:molybdate transport system substrate-binding protein